MSVPASNRALRRLLLFAGAFALGAGLSSAPARAFAPPPGQSPLGDVRYSVQLPTSKQVSPKVSVRLTLDPADAKPGALVTLSATAVIQPGWHISALGASEDGAPSLPTTLEFEPDGLTPVGDGFTPSARPEPVKIGEAVHLQHAGTVTWTREYRVDEGPGPYSGEGFIRFQACDESLCLPPKTLEFTLGGAGATATAARRVPAYRPVGDPMVVSLQRTTLERDLLNPTALVTADPEEDMSLYIEQLTGAMRMKEALTLGGKVEVAGEASWIYLAEQESYSLVNTSEDETRYGNTSTFVSIDHNGDGKIVDYESVATNRPLRIADTMWLVTEISKADATITLQAVDTPLAGAVLNRKCPEFWYETVEGDVVSDRSILGTVTILDVWAVT